MIPGGRMNPRQLELMMKRLGMTNEPVPDVEEVIIRTRDKEHVLRQPEVSILTVQGVRTYQVVGTTEVRARSASPAATSAPAAPAAPAAPPPGPPEEDVTLVMEQTGASREAALQALEESDGAPAEAIMHLLARRGGGG
ncbi:MAG: nascent polypeptide-associated complex protein [Thermoplasmata archaeon]|nr:nascent polypeptide-associated complex protein [Thermoplasmata archaeon]